MTTDKSKKMFSRLQEALENDQDPFLFFHLSLEDNCYFGLDSPWLNEKDALVIIRHLINKFDYNPEAIANMCNDKIISN